MICSICKLRLFIPESMQKVRCITCREGHHYHEVTMKQMKSESDYMWKLQNEIAGDNRYSAYA